MLAVMRQRELPIELRFDAAKMAAPYRQPKLAAVARTGADGGTHPGLCTQFPLAERARSRKQRISLSDRTHPQARMTPIPRYLSPVVTQGLPSLNGGPLGWLPPTEKLPKRLLSPMLLITPAVPHETPSPTPLPVIVDFVSQTKVFMPPSTHIPLPTLLEAFTFRSMILTTFWPALRT